MEGYQTAAVLLMGLGVLLLVAEFFLPTGGVLVVAGVGAVAVAVGVLLLYGSTAEAAAGAVGAGVGVPAAGYLLMGVWRRMARQVSLDSETVLATVATTPEAAGLAALVGRLGKTVTPMRPSGTVEFDGRRVDALTEGRMVGPGEWVKCVAARAGRVVVRGVESPGDPAGLPFDDPT